MIIRPILLLLAAFALSSLSGCATAGNIIRTVLQLPRTAIGSVTEVDGESVAPAESVADDSIDPDARASVSIVLAPAK